MVILAVKELRRQIIRIKKKEHENCTNRVVSCSFKSDKSDNRFRDIKRHFEKIFIKIITVLNMPYKIDKL